MIFIYSSSFLLVRSLPLILAPRFEPVDTQFGVKQLYQRRVPDLAPILFKI